MGTFDNTVSRFDLISARKRNIYLTFSTLISGWEKTKWKVIKQKNTVINVTKHGTDQMAETNIVSTS